MKRNFLSGLLVGLIGMALLLPIASAALAQHSSDPTAGGTLSINWWTIDGGGETFSTSAQYSVGGTIGQPDAGHMLGGGYTLSGGFWLGAVANYNIYLPLVLKNS
jgi:hypothetical protein